MQHVGCFTVCAKATPEADVVVAANRFEAIAPTEVKEAHAPVAAQATPSGNSIKIFTTDLISKSMKKKLKTMEKKKAIYEAKQKVKDQQLAVPEAIRRPPRKHVHRWAKAFQSSGGCRDNGCECTICESYCYD